MTCPFLLSPRSLVLGPTDEVDATITLSALSRQAESFLLAERTLLDPLAKMKCSLNSPIFGVGIPANLGLGISMNLGESMESIVNGDVSVQVSYRPQHEQFSQKLFTEAGGEERCVDFQAFRGILYIDQHCSHLLSFPWSRLFIQHKLYFAYIKHLWATDRKDEAMTRLGLLCKVVGMYRIIYSAQLLPIY